MRMYRQLGGQSGQAGSATEEEDAGTRSSPKWLKRLVQILGLCTCVGLLVSVLVIGGLVALAHTTSEAIAGPELEEVTPAESIPEAAQVVMIQDVPPKSKTKVKKITAGMEATLALPQLPEGLTLSKAELAKAIQVVKDGLENNQVVSAFQDLHAALSLSQTAETAAQNDMLLSDADIQELTGGAPGIMEGEQAMEAGDVDADNAAVPLRRLRGRWVGSGRPWKDGVVNYCFASDFPERSRKFFKLATKAWTLAMPCLTFVDVGWASGDQTMRGECQTAPAIFVGNDGSGCNSFVGMVGGFQKINLATPGCIWVGTAAHELGHALGMDHEQNRPDRDQYITVQWDNMEPSWRSQFRINDNSYTGGPYDYLSIMHYGQNGPPPWFTVPSSVDTKKLGQRTALSQTDIAQAFDMYADETPGCSAMDHQKSESIKGCVNSPGAPCSGPELENFCEGADFQLKHACCSCGGGILVKCFEEKGCPNHTVSLLDHIPIDLPDFTDGFREHLPSGKAALTVLIPILVVILLMFLAYCCCWCACIMLCPGFSYIAMFL